MANSIGGLNEKVLLIILDGFGIGEDKNKNAIVNANKPTIDNIFATYPWTTIEPGGEAVGLPKGVVGNSEVGHMNLGAGRPVRQDLVRINEAIEKNTLSKMPELQKFISNSRSGTKRIHLMGLLSDGGVHSHINHFKKIIEIISAESDLEIFFHAFMDGRDTQRDCGEKYIHELNKTPGFKFASMQGRSIGMDRDRRWEKIETAYNTFIGKGLIENIEPHEYLKEQYQKEKYDEFVEPVLFNKDFAIENGDSIFFLNFRPDRAIQLALAFNWEEFNEFKRPVRPGQYLCMTPYVPEEVELPILFDKEKISGCLSEYLSSQGIGQFKIAETEKYAHVTFFFNGGEKNPFKNEEHVLINSPKDVSTYDQKPEMSAYEVTDRLKEALKESQYQFYLVNFANSDMVGHTGNYDAAVKAIEALDECLKQLIQTAKEQDVTILLTADHGNSDQMSYEDGSPHTSHTGALVPFVVIDPRLEGKKLNRSSENLALKDVSPTVLHIMGIENPKEFTGKSIFS